MLASRTVSLASLAGRRGVGASARGVVSIADALEPQIEPKRAYYKELAAKYGEKKLGDVTVNHALGGARGVKCLMWETSLLDTHEGIRFRGRTIPEIQAELPATTEGGEPMPEALMWLLLTGEVPSKAQADAFTDELRQRAKGIPAHVETTLRSLPKDMHPMTQLSIGTSLLQTDSHFARAYAEGTHKLEYWRSTLEDVLNLTARIPEVAAIVYRNTYHDGVVDKSGLDTLDYSANFARMLGYDNREFDELMRLYLCIHSDHEGGNASAHTTHLVGSTLADPYLSMAAGFNALAGPLHGLANQEVLKWIQDLQKTFADRGLDVNHDTIREFAWETLNGGKVIPGYGHAVLRVTDPRYTCQRAFAQKYLPDDELFNIVSTIYEVVPGVLEEHGKTKNPWPNVDSHSGVLLWHYGFTEYTYFTCLFAVSRVMGPLSQLFWDRALGFGLERPKSISPEWIEREFADN